ncbi:hypothetical protein QR680_017951 [Steinernema hermaphroditum]|uniref:Uncharacterized protein n=1 Tax=Steinernema hermaphroditum TaxID=289476 RepID=A0AA39HIS6_9BILA|nr:hypothetical protein QR680_017951 [Steinernema hermaphroditum]
MHADSPVDGTETPAGVHLFRSERDPPELVVNGDGSGKSPNEHVISLEEGELRIARPLEYSENGLESMLRNGILFRAAEGPKIAPCTPRRLSKRFFAHSALSGFGMSTKKAVLEGHDGKQLATDQANNNRLSKRPKRAEGRGVIAKTSSATAEINNPAPLS